jgi:hypothetical protein
MQNAITSLLSSATPHAACAATAMTALLLFESQVAAAAARGLVAGLGCYIAESPLGVSRTFFNRLP